MVGRLEQAERAYWHEVGGRFEYCGSGGCREGATRCRRPRVLGENPRALMVVARGLRGVRLKLWAGGLWEVAHAPSCGARDGWTVAATRPLKGQPVAASHRATGRAPLRMPS